jgi:hypothetical protein
MNNLTKEARSKYEQMLTTTLNMVKTLWSLHNGESVSSPFDTQTPENAFGQSHDTASVFRTSVVQNSHQTLSHVLILRHFLS